MSETIDALVIGSGPAGLMAAEELAIAGYNVVIAEAKPSAGRKFLMAGKSGLNLTKDEPEAEFGTNFYGAGEVLAPILENFGPLDAQRWARELGQELFTGSSGRVFPKAMKASPLLRAWLTRLTDLGVELRTRWKWVGWDGANFVFETDAGRVHIKANRVVLALGGASWPRLGSDGAWFDYLEARGVVVVPFQSANVGLSVGWSKHMERFFGFPVKGTALTAGDLTVRGEFVITQKGLEGSGVYALSNAIRNGASLSIDLMPDWSPTKIAERLSLAKRKDTVANRLRKSLRLDAAKIGLLLEFTQPLCSANELPGRIKNLPVPVDGLRPLEEAISSAGGVSWDSVGGDLMLKDLPGVFVAGEMLDWEAPTGGYLITASLATGKWAGQHAARWR